jgi:ABC-type uncharacterized transport system permease subunit
VVVSGCWTDGSSHGIIQRAAKLTRRLKHARHEENSAERVLSWKMLPNISTILVLVLITALSKRLRAPKALGIPYIRGEKK